MYTYACVCLFRQPAFIHDRQFPVDLPPVAGRHCPFLCGLKGRQVQRLQKRCAAGEHAPLAVELAVGGIEALYGVGRTMPISA